MANFATVVRNPKLYWAWTFVVLVALVAAYPVDPYVFGFASLGLAWATGGIGIVGLAAVVLSKTATARARLAVGAALLIAGVALAVSFRILGGFRWA